MRITLAGCWVSTARGVVYGLDIEKYRGEKVRAGGKEVNAGIKAWESCCKRERNGILL